jgi:hypothetical protein
MKANQRALSGPVKAGLRLNLEKWNHAKKEFQVPNSLMEALAIVAHQHKERSLSRRKLPLD